MNGLIAIIGEGAYNEVDVIYEGKRIGTGSYTPITLKRFFNVEDDKFIVFGLKTEKTLKAVNKFNLNNSFVEIDDVSIFEKTLEKIIELKKKGCDKIILDFTHGYRTLPPGIILAGLMVRSFLNYDIELIYGEFDKEKGITKYKKLSHKYLSFLNLINKAKEIGINLKAKELYTLEKEITKGLEHKTKKNVISKMRDAEKFMFNLSLGNVHGEFLEELKVWLDKEIELNDPKIYILIEIIKKEINRIIKEINSKFVYKRQLNLGKIFINKNNLNVGVGLIRESITSAYLEKMGKDPYNFEERNNFDIVNKKTHKDKYNYIKLFRNALQHTLSSGKNYDSVKRQLGEFKNGKFVISPKFKKLDEFIDKVDKNVEEIFRD